MINFDLTKSNEKDILIPISKFLNGYSFGSGTKKDVDIELFMLLSDLGLVTPNLLDVQCKLNVSRSKAKSLLEERERRILMQKFTESSMEDVLKQELESLIKEELFECENGKIKLSVSSPMLRDFLRDELHKKKYIVDSSFSTDLVVMSYDAYKALCEEFFKDSVKKVEEVMKDNNIQKTLDDILCELTKIQKENKEKSGTAKEYIKIVLQSLCGAAFSSVDFGGITNFIGF